MRFKAFFLAFAGAVFIGSAAFAETSEIIAETPLLTEKFPLTVALDEERQIYTYSFEDNASFAATSLLSTENTLPYLWLATEDNDVQIRITSNGEAYAYSPTSVINAEGQYSVTVSHILRGNEEPVEVTFSADITDTQDILTDSSGDTIPEPIVGRLELESDSGELYHEFLGGVRVESSVLDGETVSTAVKMTVPDEVIVSATRDGENYTFPSNGIIDEDGRYKLVMTCTDKNGGMEKRTMEFRICAEPTNSIGIFQPPYNAELVSASLDGEELELPGNFVNCEKDGRYEFTYEYGNLRRSVVVNVDTRAPVLKFNGTDDITFMEPVTVTSDTPCTYTIYKNGQPTDNSPTLTGTGVFRIYAEDAAGNQSSYRVEIKAVSAVNPMNFVVIGAILAAGGVTYFMWNKKHKTRVR